VGKAIAEVAPHTVERRRRRRGEGAALFRLVNNASARGECTNVSRLVSEIAGEANL